MPANDAKSFALQIKQEWADKVEDLEEATALIGLTAFRGVVQKSPVDSGRFRGNWNASIGEPNFTTTETVDPSGSATISAATTTLGAYDATDGFPAINISNGLPYGPRLEDGYSGQAPNGMVALTITEIEAQFDGMEV
ncbi:MAG: hypothetical protein Unbinned7865contig1001_64 [Prokaryotic dsDNA virus sp.]|nr:MAG: hypothetical protein Unbinned7865contig1001_64 [Prokaryotic dsDNA virus sp.]|tara:strand:- start:10981 stop:11394 length:414 start_codon:yes stop_codon:yes gene_type:complete